MLRGFILLALLSLRPSRVSSSLDAKFQSRNRQLETSLKASSWPTTASSPFCETFAFFESSPSSSAGTLIQDYLKRLEDFVSKDGTDDFPTLLNHGMDVSMSLASQLNETTNATSSFLPMLEYSLSTRAHAPLCETHRILSQHALRYVKDTFVGAFAVVSNQGRYQVFESVQELQARFQSEDATLEQEEWVESGTDGTDAWSRILPHERLLGLDDVVTRSDLEVVVYLSVERSEWVEYTQRLRKMKIPFVVRFMGYQPQQQDACLAGDGENQVCLATNTPESAFLPTALQGYGVRLDIKNSEYKSFDDKVDGSDEASMEERIHTQTNILSDMTTFTIYDWKHFLKNGIPFNLDMNDNPQFINFISHHLSHLKSEDAMYSYHTHTMEDLL